MKKLVPCFLFILTLAFIYQSNSFASISEKTNINASPDTALFYLENLKPGDWAVKKLTIQNREEKDMIYNSNSSFISGSVKLHNEFLLKIWDSKSTLYDGKLKDFSGLEPRSLKSFYQEDLLFRVDFPYELGNDYQGLGFQVEFKFFVEGFGSVPDPDPNTNPVPDPNTDPNLNPSPSPDSDPKPAPDTNSDPVQDLPDSSPDLPNPDSNPNPSPDPNLDPNPDLSPNPDTKDQMKPENPSRPIEPIDPPSEEENIKPQRPISEEERNSDPVDGKILPKTASNIYNYIFIGLFLLLVSLILYISESAYTNYKNTKETR